MAVSFFFFRTSDRNHNMRKILQSNEQQMQRTEAFSTFLSLKFRTKSLFVVPLRGLGELWRYGLEKIIEENEVTKYLDVEGENLENLIFFFFLLNFSLVLFRQPGCVESSIKQCSVFFVRAWNFVSKGRKPPHHLIFMINSLMT